MNCERVEYLLPLYVDEELPTEARDLLEAHLRQCPMCRESLAFYNDLELSLVGRRSQLPPASGAADRIVKRMGLRRQRRPIRIPVGLPAVLSAVFIIAGIIMLFARGALARFSTWFSGELSPLVVPVLERFTRDILAVTGGDEWTVLTLYFGILAIILLTGSWLVLRFVRE